MKEKVENLGNGQAGIIGDVWKKIKSGLPFGGSAGTEAETKKTKEPQAPAQDSKPAQYKTFSEYMEKEGWARIEEKWQTQQLQKGPFDLNAFKKYLKEEKMPEIKRRLEEEIEQREKELKIFQKFHSPSEKTSDLELALYTNGVKWRQKELNAIKLRLNSLEESYKL